jgi:DNA-directed RNA polymerase subunit K/omega
MSKVYFTEELTDEEGINPYEAVLLASRESRRLNKIRLVAGVPEGEEKITSIALGRIVDEKIRVTYGSDADGDNDAAAGKTNSSRR